MRGHVYNEQVIHVRCDASPTGRHSLRCVFSVEEHEPRIKKPEYRNLPILVHVSADCDDWRAAKAAVALGAKHSCALAALAVRFAVDSVAVDGTWMRRTSGDRAIDVEAALPDPVRDIVKRAVKRVDYLQRQRLGASGEAALSLRRLRQKANPRGVRKPWAPPKAKQNTLLWALLGFVKRHGRSPVQPTTPAEEAILERRVPMWETRINKEKNTIEICARTRTDVSVPVITRERRAGARWSIDTGAFEGNHWRLGRVAIGRSSDTGACAFCDPRKEYARTQDVNRHFESPKHKACVSAVLAGVVNGLNKLGEGKL